MKIGILTFHWAINYGAVLQCYALQKTLVDMGHQVEIINYKPRRFDDSLYQFLRQRKFLQLREYLNLCRKEKSIRGFRDIKLNLTQRVYTQVEISQLANNYDVVISGSDQVMNPYFLMNGEGDGKITPSYFLGFPSKCKKIGYAVSFGCVNYPKQERDVASKYIVDFDAIGVRECSGVEIIKSMGREDAVVLPDPTILLPTSYYHDLADEWDVAINKRNFYVYSFFIRNLSERRKAINTLVTEDIVWNNEDADYTIQGWLGKIKRSQLVITDSFHCMVMCLKLHKPFIVVTNEVGNVGMNDRFYSLLNYLHLSDRIVYKGSLSSILFIQKQGINWMEVDALLDTYKKIGVEFLTQAMC